MRPEGGSLDSDFAPLRARSRKRNQVSPQVNVTTDGLRAEEHDGGEDVGREPVDPGNGGCELRTPVAESSRAMAEDVEMLLEEADVMVELFEVVVDLSDLLVSLGHFVRGGGEEECNTLESEDLIPAQR